MFCFFACFVIYECQGLWTGLIIWKVKSQPNSFVVGSMLRLVREFNINAILRLLLSWNILLSYWVTTKIHIHKRNSLIRKKGKWDCCKQGSNRTGDINVIKNLGVKILKHFPSTMSIGYAGLCRLQRVFCFSCDFLQQTKCWHGCILLKQKQAAAPCFIPLGICNMYLGVFGRDDEIDKWRVNKNCQKKYF